MAGPEVPWELIDTASVTVDHANRLIMALQQSAFSQWTIVSDAKDNPFADVLAPSIAGITADPTVATATGDVVISAQITDESDLQSVQLFYIRGGEASFTSTAMTLDNADTSTVLLLHMDEVGGPLVFDASASGNHGTASGTTVVSGRFGSGRSVVNGNIGMPYSVSLNFGAGNFTLEAWIKITGPEYDTHIFSKWGQAFYEIANWGGPTMHIQISDGSGVQGHHVTVSGTTPINDGRWHHVAGVREDGSLRLYVDGILDGSADVWLVGSLNNTGSMNFSSQAMVIDEVRLSTVARSPEEFNVPQPPEHLVTDAGDQQVQLAWNVSTTTNVMQYRIYRSTMLPDYTLIDSVAAPAAEYPDTDVTNGTLYYYRVTAVDSIGVESAFTDHAYTIPFATLLGEYVRDANTVLLMHMNEPSGPLVFDASGHHNDGVAYGSTIVEGRFGKARESHSHSEWVSVPHDASLNFGEGPYTLEAWVYIEPDAGGHLFYHKRGNNGRGWYTSYNWDGTVSMGVYNDPNLSGEQGNTGLGSYQKINDSRWHHVAWICTGTELRIYIDGALDNSTPLNTLGSPDNTGGLGLVYGHNDVTGVIRMDEVRISNTIRTPEEFNIPLQPVGLTANSDNGHVRLTWSPSPTPDIAQYDVYRSTSIAADTLIDSVAVPQTAYIDTNVVSGTTYFYRLKAIDSNGFDSGLTPRVSIALGELFSRVTSGPVVTDGGSPRGVAWGDYDNDGNLDLFITNDHGQHNYLYANQGGGVFLRVTSGEVVSDGGYSQGCSWGDYDNDGDLDLFVANANGENNSLYKNNGDGTFSKVTDGPVVTDGGTSRSGTWGDYDSDGDLDLFVANSENEFNFLYTNNGDGTFNRVTEGPVVTDEEASYGGIWGDYDSDGDLDLFVANQWSQYNSLYNNNGDGSFTKITTGPVVETGSDSYGGSWGDYDNDGDLDLFVTNCCNQGDFLFSNNGDGTFTHEITSAVASANQHSYGSAWADYDNDGDLDLFVTTEDSEQNNALYRNNGDGTFTRVAEGQVANDRFYAHGSAWADYDNDGDVDLLVGMEHGEGNFLYTNNGNSNSWINILAVGTVSNRSAIGAKVRVLAATDGVTPVWQLREISAQTGYGSQNSLNAEFGLGQATIIDSIVVEWLSLPGQGSAVQVLTDVAVNQFLTIVDSTLITHTEIITSDGPVEFAGTGVTLDFTFTSQTGADTIEVAEYQAAPQGTFPDTVVVVTTRYWTIDHKGAGLFSVDMTLAMEPGTFSGEDQAFPANLKLLRRDGSDDPWTVSAAGTGATDSSVTFTGLSGFSQFTIGRYKPDVEGPLITDIDISADPSIHQPVTIQVTVRDPKGVQSVDLLYLKGGGTAGYTTVPMTSQGEGAYTGIIPGSIVTVSGIAFFISALDNIGNTGYTDTISIPIHFPSGTITTGISGSAYPDGFPKTKWRLFSLPGDLDENSLSTTIQDELGGPPSDPTWKLYRYTGSGTSPYAKATSFAPGECYWLIQAVEDNINFSLGAGSSFDLTGLALTIGPRKWRFISSPYAFPVTVNVDQGIFYGPFTYGPFGSDGQEGWSTGQVQTTFKPWGGYIVYNNTDETQSLEIKPPGLAKAILAKSEDHSLEEGWLLHLTVEGERYFDGGSAIGRVQNALEGRDDYDHPEPPWLDGYVSLAMVRPDWGNDLPRFTSDIRSSEKVNGVWDMDIFTKGESGPITLTSELKGDVPADFKVVLLDVITRQFHDLLDANSPVIITDYREEFPYHLKAVAGSQAWVDATVQEILAQLPSEFALSQNYPNPFNPVTHIRFTLPRPDKVTLRVYNLLGREVATLKEEWLDLGEHEVLWNGYDRFGRPLPSGVYFARLAGSGHSRTVKMVLMK